MQSVFDKVNPTLEKTIWSEFASQLDKSIDVKWFLATGNSELNRPGMLGYVMGYRICEAYYKRAKNKEDALRSIVSLSDSKDIYEASGYGK